MYFSNVQITNIKAEYWLHIYVFLCILTVIKQNLSVFL